MNPKRLLMGGLIGLSVVTGGLSACDKQPEKPKVEKKEFTKDEMMMRVFEILKEVQELVSTACADYENRDIVEIDDSNKSAVFGEMNNGLTVKSKYHKEHQTTSYLVARSSDVDEDRYQVEFGFNWKKNLKYVDITFLSETRDSPFFEYNGQVLRCTLSVDGNEDPYFNCSIKGGLGFFYKLSDDVISRITLAAKNVQTAGSRYTKADHKAHICPEGTEKVGD